MDPGHFESFRNSDYLRNMFHPDYEHHTRNITTGNLRTTEMKTGLGKKAIRVRGTTYWNSLPPELKGFNGKLLSFKKELKAWVKTNIEM